jgi:hypothetical protein
MLVRGVKVAALCLALFLALDLLISALVFGGVSRDTAARQHQDAQNRAYRIPHPLFHHALRPGYDGEAVFGPNRYRIRTNSLGFVDRQTREVAKVSDRSRMVVIGDSFTEGLGFPWDQTFVGRVAAALPQTEVLNAGLSGTSPTIHYVKTKWLLDSGYKVDHVLVMLDVSDLHDDWLSYVENGAVRRRPEPRPEGFGARMREMVPKYLQLSFLSYQLARSVVRPGRTGIGGADVFNVETRAWTYDRSPRIDSMFQPHGIDGAIRVTVDWMDRLHRLLQARGIGMSVGVYPWPQQLHHNDEHSSHVKLWRDWCRGRCTHFIDAYPDFFAMKREQGERWYAHAFIPGDVHYNERGNAILAARVLAEMRKSLATR